MRLGPLDCPDCGTPAMAPSERCDTCGGRLLTERCKHCNDWTFRSSSTCWKCGHPTSRFTAPPVNPNAETCPRCEAPLEAGAIGSVPIAACSNCRGTWMEREVFERLQRDRAARDEVLPGEAPPHVPLSVTDPIRYLPCPHCRTPMNRVHFAGRSKVVLDVCHDHGWWFDDGELHRVVAFLRDEAALAAERASRNARMIPRDPGADNEPPLELEPIPPRQWKPPIPIVLAGQSSSTRSWPAELVEALAEFLLSLLLGH